MVRILHILCKAGIATWTLGCGLFTILMLFGIGSNVHHASEASAAGVMSFMSLIFIGSVWFFPTITMMIIAYFTRPQAWLPVKEQNATY